ncbi:reverse transcriptase domain-containing protein [Tanacetum coccineum]
MDGGRVERNSKGRLSKRRAEDNMHQEVSLPPLLAAYLGRNENGEPLQSSLTFAHGGHQPLVNAGGNLPPNGLFAESTGCVTTFVRWIEDYPLPDGLKMPSHVGSYDEKGDPNNYLHLFEGAIRMQKWAMLVACHMFTYTLKDSARIWRRTKEVSLKVTKGVLSCADAEERIVVNDKYLEQTAIIGKQLPHTFKKRLQVLLRLNVDIFSWTHTDMMGIPRTITVGGKPFNIEHKLNEYKHIKPVKQKKHGLDPDHSEAACKEVEELMKAGIPQKMPFGLKNAGATYQTLVDKVFSDQTGRNLEAFVDDIVIKSTSKEDTIKDIQETFDRQWKENVEEAFQKMKNFMEILPTLTAPIKGEVLVMYLPTSTENISDVLLAERGEEQVPIYFVSRVLQGEKLNYPGLEKSY